MGENNKELVLENMIFNTVIRAFAEQNVPYTTASLIMRSVAGRIDNLALQALTDENFQLRKTMAEKEKVTAKKPEEMTENE